jgi:hypothetical protein
MPPHQEDIDLMTRISTGIVATLAALSFATVACSKDKGDKAGDTAAKPGDKAGAAGAAAGGTMPSTGYAVFPADAELVMSFSLEGLRASPMWPKIAPMFQAKIDEEMKEIKEACGFDPVAKLQSVLVGGKPSDEDNMVIVVRGFSKAEMATCGEAMAKKEGTEFSITEEDGLTKMRSEGKDVYIAWLDPTTAVMSPSSDKAFVQARKDGKNGLDTNAAFMELLKNVDSGATVWVAALPAAGSDMDMSAMAPGAKGAFGSLRVTDGLAIDAGVRFDTADNAKSAHSMATAGLQQAKGMMPPQIQSVIDKTKIEAANTDVLVKLTLSSADLEALTSALGALVPGMMGAMPK